jgi:hypothetical protein
MTNARNTGFYGRVDPGPGYGTQYDYVTSTVLTAAQDGALITNSGSPNAITLTLPPAVAGMEFAIQRVSPYAVTVEPDGSDTIRGGAGAILLQSRSTTVLACRADGAWEIVIGSSERVFVVDDFGASGDGTTDDTAAIKAARNAAAASSIAPTLLFRAGGRYRVLDASLIEAFDGLTVSGYGATIYVPSVGVTVRDASATDTYTYDNGLIYKTDGDVSRLTVEGLTLETDLATVGLIGIGDSGTTGGSIVGADIKIMDCRQDGGNSWVVVGCQNLAIHGCYISDTTSTALFVPNNENTKISGNRIEFVGVDRAYADWANVAAISGNNNKHITIENNHIEATGGTSILIRAASKPITDVVIRGNTLTSCGLSGIEARVRSNASANSYLRNVNISGNVIHGFLCANISTTLTAAAITGAATLTVASIEGLDDDATISIVLSDASVHTTTINGTPTGSTVTLTDVVAAPGALNGALVTAGSCNHNGIDVGTDKSAYEARDIVVSGNVVNFLSPQETWNNTDYDVDGSANIHKAKNNDLGSAHGILIFGTGVSGPVEDFAVTGNTVTHCPTVGILTSYAINGTISGNSLHRNGWQRDASDIPYGSAHGVFCSISAAVNVTGNTIRENNPGCDGAASARTVVIQSTDSYLINVCDNVVLGNDTTTAGDAWSAVAVGFTCNAAGFTLTAFATAAPTCSTFVSGNRVAGTYFGLTGGGAGTHVRHYSAQGFLTVKDDDYIATITAASGVAVLPGVTTVLGARTSTTMAFSIPNPALVPGQTVTIKHQGLGAGDITLSAAAGTINGATTIAADTWAAYRAVGSVWEQIA